MTKGRSLSFSLAACAWILVWTQPCNAEPSSQPGCTLGFIAGLSGPGSVYGIAPRRGVELALEDIPDPSLTIIFEDDQFIPRNTVTAFRRLMAVPQMYAVTVVGASPALAIAPIAEREHLPLIAVASDERLGQSGGSVVRAWASGTQEGQLLAEGADRRQLSKVLFLNDVDDYSMAVAEGFKLATRAQLIAEELPPEIGDIGTLLLKHRAQESDELNLMGIGICARAGRVAAVAQQVRAAGYRGEIFGCVTLENAAEVRAAKGALKGAWFATSAVRPEFRRRYRERFGEEDFLGGAAVFYDLTFRIEELCREGIERKMIPDRLLEAGRARDSSERVAPRALLSLITDEASSLRALSPKLVIRSVEDLMQ